MEMKNGIRLSVVHLMIMVILLRWMNMGISIFLEELILMETVDMTSG